MESGSGESGPEFDASGASREFSSSGEASDWTGAEEWQGTIIIELPIAVRSLSGREKQTDPDAQGAWIVAWMNETMPSLGDDTKVGEATVVNHRKEHWTEW